MLWALVINICLANGSETECREWRVEPFNTAYECQREGRKLIAEVGDVAYVNAECEIGLYS